MPLKIRLTGQSALAVALLFLLTSQWHSSAAATRKRIYLAEEHRTFPVVITGVDLGPNRVQEGRFRRLHVDDPVTPFYAGDDWIQNLTIHLLNRTDKDVLATAIHVSFPETDAGHGFVVWELRLGSTYIDDHRQPRQWNGVPFSLLAGQALAIHLSDYIDRIKARVERPSVLPMAAMTEVAVQVYRPVFFSDGTMWDGERYLFLNTQTHAREPRPRDYFPGDLDLWPGMPASNSAVGATRRPSPVK